MIYNLKIEDIEFDYNEIESFKYLYKSDINYGSLDKKVLEVQIRIKCFSTNNQDNDDILRNINNIKTLLKWSQHKRTLENQKKLCFKIKDMNNLTLSFTDMYISSIEGVFESKDGNGFYDIIFTQKYNISENNFSVEV